MQTIRMEMAVRLHLIVKLSLVLVAISASAMADEGDSKPKLDPEHAKKMARGLDLFKKSVRPMLVGRCLKCHGGKSVESELELTTREKLMKGGASGAVVVPGKPMESRLYKLAAHLEEPFMPEGGAKLTKIALEQLANWIELGAPYDKPLTTESDEDPLAWTKRVIDDSRREFWSFQPLADSSPPEVPGDWSRTPIDKFVLAKLNAQGLHPNPIADRRRLIRRAYFDLIGLPPPAEEVETFVNDPDPEAFAKLIDRLLESQHYGERWGRHWLDIARFAESHGFEQDYDRPHAYHYRDFVIKALNGDMPYDQFVRWQLAGDETDPENPLALMATGFLGAGVFPTQLTEKEFESARYDALDDMASTTGTAFLGLTIGCARCHDHKFDPIPAADYYRLLSSFTTAIRSNIELDLDGASTQQAIASWEQQHAPLVAARAEFEQKQLPERFEAWLKEQPQEPRSPASWIVLDLVEYNSAAGATLKKQGDGSLLASGANPDFDKYTLVAETHLTNITSIRLEALKHDSMVKGGPGRAGNGNMGLGTFSLMAKPLSGKGEAVRVGLKNSRATFQQNEGHLSIAASLDDQPNSGWAVDPQFGKDHAAVFDVESAIGFEGGTKLTFTLDFKVNNKHNIGRPRLSISTAQTPVALDGKAEQQHVAEILAVLSRDDGKLTAAQRKTLMKWYRTTDEEWAKLNRVVEEHLGKKPQPKLTNVMVVSEGFKPIKHNADGRGFPHFYPDTFFLNRGDANQKRGVAQQGFLQVLMSAGASQDDSAKSRWLQTPPEGWRTSYRRRALADWMTDAEDGAGELLARVIVNRLWQHHLGRGIVATPNDFGFQGERPTHPELLDWLAGRLIEGGWKLKPIHKLIMTTATYMQTSDSQEDGRRIDPANQWLWRKTPRRLEAEIIRDSMLSVGGELDRTMFGPGTLDEGMKRRSIYFTIKRSKLIPMMQVFDAPEPLVGVGNRPSTTIAPQALTFLNGAHVRRYARGFAKQILAPASESVSDTVHAAYLASVARPPSDEELREAVAFVESQQASYEADKKDDAAKLALADFCHVLLSLNEFIYVD
jgi:hypothetical protein